MPCICAIAGAIPPDYVDASYSSKTEKKASVDAEGNFDPKPVDTTKYDTDAVFKLIRSARYGFIMNTFACWWYFDFVALLSSTIIPEKLDGFINRYAEYTHDKWAFEKVELIRVHHWIYFHVENVCVVFCRASHPVVVALVLDYFLFFMHLQIQNNWTFGEVLDENAKTHPMLRPYKTFSEKVGEGYCFFFIIIPEQIYHRVLLHMFCMLCFAG